MRGNAIHSKPIRLGIFDSVPQADQVVEQLLAAGFSKEQITVISSDARKEMYFQEFEHQKPGGARTPVAAATGSAIGAVLGGLSSVVGLVTTAGIGVFATPSLISTGAIVGGFIGAMMTRGIDKELANYYDQAVERGAILVAAEEQGDAAESRLAEAETIFRQAGSRPVPILEG